MSGELDARPAARGLINKSPLPEVHILKAPSVAGDEDVSMNADEGGDETEDEGRGDDGRMIVDGARIGAPPTTAFERPRRHETQSSSLAPLDPKQLASANGWRTPPAPTAARLSPPGSGPSEEAAALLLNFSAVASPTEPPPSTEKAPPAPGPSYPRTPPLDSPNPSAPSAPPSAAVPITSTQTPSSPSGLPTPSAPSPDTAASSSSKPAKPKRKRNAVAGPSRHSSTEASSTDRPPHWMGADNSVIRCICGLTEDDGFTVLCERCNAWEHALCFGYRDESRLPDIFLCELCLPRPLPFSAEQARGLQLQARANYEARRGVERPAEEAEQKRRPKTKRPRTTDPSTVKETPETTEESRDSPGGMGPPLIKPKRRSQPGKPRSNAASLKDAHEDEEYFRILPWELEYTPLKDNLIRGRACRQAMTQLYHEWADGEEDTPRKPRPVHHDSGLPSPTETGLRLSPDNLLSPPDFSILAPPVPPVFLSGASLTALEANTSIRPIEESSSICYLPLKYMEPSSGIYPRPTLYGVFALDPISLGSFIGEFRGEVLDAASYRQDPINQYAALGVPKPYVRSVGPPVNLILDARSYGNEMRFIRSGCHPNAVIRPIFFRPHDSATSKLRFGIFAARELAKNEEIILGWEWDDQHVVHTLRAVIDSTLKNSANKPGIPAAVMEELGTKFDAILTNIFGTFQSCACTVTTDCAFSQMRRLVNKQTFHGVSGQRARKRIDLGELLGAVRGWRRRELEEAAAAKARQYRSSGEWEVWRAGPDNDESDKEDVDRELSRPASDVDDHELDMEEEEEVAPPEEPKLEEETREEEEEVAVEVKPAEEEIPAPAEAAVEPEPEPKEDDETDNEMTPVPISAPSPPPQDDAMDVDEPVDDVPAKPTIESKPAATEAKVEADGDVVMDDEPVTPVTAKPPQEAPSSALSSVPQDDHPAREEGEEELSGNESDATTMTIIRSDASNSDAESEAEVDVRPAATRRGRRVLSPSGDSSHGSLTPPEEEKVAPPEPEDKKPEKPRSRSAPKAKPVPMPPTSTPPRPANDRKRRSRKNVIASSDEESSAEESEPAPSSKPSPKRARPAPSKLRAKKKQRQELTDESESEKENVVRLRKERKEERKPERSDKVDKKAKGKDKINSKDERKAELEREEKDKADREEAREREREEKKAEKERERVEKEKAKAELEKEKDAKAEREKEERRAERAEREREKAEKKAEREREREREREEKEKEKREEKAKLEDKSKADRIERKAKKDKSVKDKSDKGEAKAKEETKSSDSKPPSKASSDSKPTSKASSDAKPSSKASSEAKPVSKASEAASDAPAREPSPDRSTPILAEVPVSETPKEQTPKPEPVEEAAAAEKEPTPPPVPAPRPKKVSMKEYLATHKIRKHSAPEPAPEPTPEVKEKEKEPEKPEVKEAPAAPPAPAVVVEEDVKPVLTVTTAAQNARLNLLEHLPSARPGTAVPLGTPFTPTTPRQLTTSTPSAAYVPRASDHLPSTGASFAPRPSPSYMPRALDDPTPPGLAVPSPSFNPRDQDHLGPGHSPLANRMPLPPAQTPPRPSHALPDMPSALGTRDGPPHHTTPGYGPRAPPTGPRIPPTGPRGSWGGPSPGSSGPVSPVASLRPPYPPRGGFGGRGGFGDRGGGWNRGRGFRGRGRGGM